MKVHCLVNSVFWKTQIYWKITCLVRVHCKGWGHPFSVHSDPCIINSTGRNSDYRKLVRSIVRSREDSRRSVITGSDVSDDVIKHDLVSAIKLNLTHYFSTKGNICGQNTLEFFCFCIQISEQSRVRQTKR